jgi:hypothetical protein
MILAVMFMSNRSLVRAQDASQKTSSSATDSEKLASKPKKIYTNDDLHGGSGDDYGSLPPGFDPINDCNTACFDRIRTFAQVDTNANPNWRHDALAAVDLIRSDTEWQRFLRDFYNAQYRLCMLGNDQRTDMARTADPHNVTPQEIVVAEKYDAKLKELQAELQALRVRGSGLQRKYVSNRMAYQFTVLQTSWVANVYFYRVQYLVPR